MSEKLLDQSKEILFIKENIFNESNAGEPMVSIIIPFYNRLSMLIKTLKSVCVQNYTNIEIILIDDHSQDNYYDKINTTLDSIQKNWKFIRLKENKGPGFARKTGMDYSKGDYIQFLDSDDELYPEKIRKQIHAMEGDKKLIMSYVKTEYGTTSENMQILGRSHQNFSKIIPEFLIRLNWTTSSCLWRKRSIDSRWWKNLYCSEDTLFEFMAGLCDLEICLVKSETPLVRKWIHSENLTKNIASDYNNQKDIIKSYDFMVKELKKYRGNLDLYPILGYLYFNKIMFFLEWRKYEDALYCIQQSNKLLKEKLPLELIICNYLIKFLSVPLVLSLYRKYRWLEKILSNTIKKISSV